MVIISGGDGEWAKFLRISFKHGGFEEVLTPSRRELDVSETSSIKAYFRQIFHQLKRNIELSPPSALKLVCNAGVVEAEIFSKMGMANWHRTLQVNLRGAAICAREALRIWQDLQIHDLQHDSQIKFIKKNPTFNRDFADKSEGKTCEKVPSHKSGEEKLLQKNMWKSNRNQKPNLAIIFVGSFSAIEPNFGLAAYAAAKAGLIGLTKSLAREFGASGVRINCVLPGFMRTKMSAEMSKQAQEQMLAKHCLPQLASMQESADFVVYLAKMHGVSGQVFNLDSRICANSGF